VPKPPAITTKIRVQDETWQVPRGFGIAYRRLAKNIVNDGTDKRLTEVIDLLALVGYEATYAQVAGWNLRRRVEAVIFAGTEHARASDNPVPRHPRPDWLPERPWQGPPRGFGVFAGPGGTPIEEASTTSGRQLDDPHAGVPQETVDLGSSEISAILSNQEST
jgi:hypothetical protein